MNYDKDLIYDRPSLIESTVKIIGECMKGQSISRLGSMNDNLM